MIAIGSILSAFKLVKTGIGVVKGLAVAYRMWILGAAIGAALLTGFNYIDNHGEMKATIKAYEITLADQEADKQSLRDALASCEQRISDTNEARREELAEARIRLGLANQLSFDLRQEVERVHEELEVTRFETLEAIRDDEDFADWVDGTVPSAAWRLLKQASEGRSEGN
jgi:hypothetical protein